jgi:hypothetical protein
MRNLIIGLLVVNFAAAVLTIVLLLEAPEFESIVQLSPRSMRLILVFSAASIAATMGLGYFLDKAEKRRRQ